MSAQKFNMVDFARLVVLDREVNESSVITFVRPPSQEAIDAIVRRHRGTYDFIKQLSGEPIDEKFWNEVYVPELSRKLKGFV